MERDPRYAWLALNRIVGIGPVLYRRLLERFASPERVFRAGLSALRSVEGLGEKTARAISGFKDREAVLREIEGLDRLGIRLVTLTDLEYPPLLGRIYDPPPLLYCRGGGFAPRRPAVALVGSRNSSSYGVKITERLAFSLAQQGVTVVSGLARGIDTAAHGGALMAGGHTIAVLGSGLDVVYPSENQGLYDRIAEAGLVCSEYPLGTLPERQNFPVRNRVISGLSLGVVIVEAAQHSGSLITARLALEQGREVFAVPGSIESFRSAGTHGLIKQGAKLVEHAGDILEEIAWPAFAADPEKTPKIRPPDEARLTAEQRPLWEMMAAGPVHVDRLAREIGQPVGPLLSRLLEMELQGLVKQLPGKFFERGK